MTQRNAPFTLIRKTQTSQAEAQNPQNRELLYSDTLNQFPHTLGPKQLPNPEFLVSPHHTLARSCTIPVDCGAPLKQNPKSPKTQATNSSNTCRKHSKPRDPKPSKPSALNPKTQALNAEAPRPVRPSPCRTSGEVVAIGPRLGSKGCLGILGLGFRSLGFSGLRFGFAV